VPNEHAENAGTRKRRHPKSFRLDPLENDIDVKRTLLRAPVNVVGRRDRIFGEQPRLRQGRASNTMLKGVSVALRTLAKPTSLIAEDIFANPACAPKAAPTG
jgi:hypothetical protein